MQSTLLLEQHLDLLPRKKLSQLITESLYFNISSLKYPQFPTFGPSAINAIDFDKAEAKYLLSGNTEGSIKLFKVDLRAGDESIKTYNTDQDGDIKDESDEIKFSANKSLLMSAISKRTHGDAHQYGITNVKWWPVDTGMFLSSSYDGLLKVWDTSTLEQAFEFTLGGRVNNFAVNPRSSMIAVAFESSHIRLLDLNSTSSVQSLTGHQGEVLSCEWSPTKENILASGSSIGEVKLWDVRFMKKCLFDLDIQKTQIDYEDSDDESNETSKRFRYTPSRGPIKAHVGAVNGIKFLESGKTLVTTAMDDKIRVWDLDHNVNTLSNFGPLVRNKKRNYKSMVITPQKETEVQYLFYPSDTGEILMYRVHDGKLVSRLNNGSSNLKEKNLCLTYCGFNSGSLLSGTSDGSIRSWGSKRDDLEAYSTLNDDSDDGF